MGFNTEDYGKPSTQGVHLVFTRNEEFTQGIQVAQGKGEFACRHGSVIADEDRASALRDLWCLRVLGYQIQDRSHTELFAPPLHRQIRSAARRPKPSSACLGRWPLEASLSWMVLSHNVAPTLLTVSTDVRCCLLAGQSCSSSR